MTHEYTPVVRERPEHLETKSTIDTVIVPSPAEVPHSSRTGAAVSDDERNDSMMVPGTFAAGNGVQNTDERRGARASRDSDRSGVSRGSGGTRRSTGKGTTGAGTSGSSTSKAGVPSTGTGPATDPGGQAEKSD